jgi:hypothetical protein
LLPSFRLTGRIMTFDFPAARQLSTAEKRRLPADKIVSSPAQRLNHTVPSGTPGSGS